MRAVILAVALAFMPAPAAHAQSEDAISAATQIIDTIEPAEVALNTELRAWESGMRRALREDPMVAKLEQEHPGTIEAGLAGGRPVVVKILEGSVAKLRAEKIRLLVQHMSVGELDEFGDFVRSGAGNKFFKSMRANASPEALVDGVMERAEKTGEKEITKADADRALKRTLTGVQKDLSAAETLAILKFEQSQAGRKLQQVNVDVQKATLDLANNPDPKLMAKQSDTIMKAMIAFIDARPAAKK